MSNPYEVIDQPLIKERAHYEGNSVPNFHAERHNRPPPNQQQNNSFQNNAYQINNSYNQPNPNPSFNYNPNPNPNFNPNNPY